MSSLMQFSGQITKEGVHLPFYQTQQGVESYRTPHFTGTWDDNGPVYKGEDIHYHTEATAPAVDEVPCYICNKTHPRIWIAIRKPCGMMGVWVQFRYNGDIHVPDLSVPISIWKMPKDAVKMTDQESSLYWHDGKE